MSIDYFVSPDAPYMTMYSLPHILYLAFCAVTIFLFIRWGKRVREHREPVGKVMLGIILFQQIFLMYGWYLLFEDELLANALPLEMYRISTLLTIAFLVTKKKGFMDIIFYFSIYAVTSLVYPKNIYHLAHVNGVSYMINHLMTVITPIFGVLAYDWKPSWRACKKACIAFTVYLPTVILVNSLTGGNYFYLVDRPFWNDMSPWLFDLIAYVVTVGGFCLVTWLVEVLTKAFSKEKAAV